MPSHTSSPLPCPPLTPPACFRPTTAAKTFPQKGHPLSALPAAVCSFSSQPSPPPPGRPPSTFPRHPFPACTNSQQRNEEVSVQAPAGRVGGARRNERGVARRADERRDARVDGHGHAEAAEERGAVDVERVAALPAAALLRVVRLHTHDRCARVLRTRAARGACDGGVALHHRQQRLLVILVYL
eukprot:298013-Chlamydomonas_euryale.AAC.1